jgi:hypothetical protein
MAESGGMDLNADGTRSGRTAVQGPFREAALYQRPETSTNVSFVGT